MVNNLYVAITSFSAEVIQNMASVCEWMFTYQITIFGIPYVPVSIMLGAGATVYLVYTLISYVTNVIN